MADSSPTDLALRYADVMKDNCVMYWKALSPDETFPESDEDVMNEVLEMPAAIEERTLAQRYLVAHSQMRELEKEIPFIKYTDFKKRYEEWAAQTGEVMIELGTRYATNQFYFDPVRCTRIDKKMRQIQVIEKHLKDAGLIPRSNINLGG